MQIRTTTPVSRRHHLVLIVEEGEELPRVLEGHANTRTSQQDFDFPSFLKDMVVLTHAQTNSQCAQPLF